MNPSCFIIVAIFGTLGTNVFASHEQANDTRIHNHHSSLNITGLNFTRLDDYKHHNGLDLDSSSMVQNDEVIADNHDVKRIWFVVARRPGFASGIIPNFFENSSFVGFNLTSPLSNLPTFDDVKNSTSSLTSNLGRFLSSFQRQRRSSNYAFPLLPTLAAMDASLNHTSNQTNETMTAFSKYVFPLLPSIANISAMPFYLNQTNVTMAANSAVASPIFPFLMPSLNVNKSSSERQRRSPSYTFPFFPSFTQIAVISVASNPLSNTTNETIATSTPASPSFDSSLFPSLVNISSMPYTLNAISNQNNMTMANTTAPFPLPLRNMTKRAVSGDIYFPLFNMVMTANLNDSSPSADKTTSANEKFPLTYAKFKNNTMNLLHSILPSIYRRSPNED